MTPTYLSAVAGGLFLYCQAICQQRCWGTFGRATFGMQGRHPHHCAKHSSAWQRGLQEGHQQTALSTASFVPFSSKLTFQSPEYSSPWNSMCLPCSLLSSPQCKQWCFSSLFSMSRTYAMAPTQKHEERFQRIDLKVEMFSLQGKPLQSQCQAWTGEGGVQPEHLKTLCCLQLHSPFQNGSPFWAGLSDPSPASSSSCCSLHRQCLPALTACFRSPQCKKLSWQQLAPCGIFPIVTLSSARENNLQQTRQVVQIPCHAWPLAESIGVGRGAKSPYAPCSTGTIYLKPTPETRVNFTGID